MMDDINGWDTYPFIDEIVIIDDRRGLISHKMSGMSCLGCFIPHHDQDIGGIVAGSSLPGEARIRYPDHVEKDAIPGPVKRNMGLGRPVLGPQSPVINMASVTSLRLAIILCVEQDEINTLRWWILGKNTGKLEDYPNPTGPIIGPVDG